MLSEFLRVFFAAAVVGVLPGWFWARSLHPGGDLAIKVCLSVALSFALVPAVALVPARFIFSGVTLPIALFSALGVFVAGIAVYLAWGESSEKSPTPLAPMPGLVPATGTLIALAAASGTMVAVYLGAPLAWTLPVLGLLLVAAAVSHRRSGRLVAAPSAPQEAPREAPSWAEPARKGLLAATLGLVLFRGYSGPVIHDWPFIRGVDQYNHAVMANQMLSVGEIKPYLIYPPGFHIITAAISRLSGLRPLEIFPALGPALLLLPVLALYALARRLWGPWCGLAAAFIGGLVFSGAYQYFSDAMYPNMTAAQFLMVLAIAALCEVYARPSLRTGALFVLLGGAVVMFHQVASLYLALLLALVGVVTLLLLRRDRRRALAVLGSLCGVALLSLAYAWDTYGVWDAIRGVGEAPETGGTREAILMAIGSQMPFYPADLIGIVLTEPVTWLGLFGGTLLVLYRPAERAEESRTVYRLIRTTLLLWLGIMVAGAATPLSGFPQRFARDLGVPLSLLAALALVMLVAALARRGSTAPVVLSLAVPLLATAIGMQAWLNLEGSTGKSTPLVFTTGLTSSPGIAAGGEWLREHNEGGQIMVSPQLNQVPSRMMLAMGEYSGMQSYPEQNIENNRDLPPAGAGAMRDVLWVMTHPEGPRTERYLERYDIRYLVLLKDIPDRPVIPYWTLFDDPGLPYETVFENEDVLIVEPRQTESA